MLTQDRRIFERIKVDFDVDVKESCNDVPYNSASIDLSASGIGIISHKAISSQDKIELWLKFPDGHQPFHTQGEVVWSEKNRDDSWRTGIVFDNIRFMGLWRVWPYLKFQNPTFSETS